MLDNRGFTVLELLVAISLAGIMSGFTLFSIGEITDSFNRSDSQTQFRKHLRLAQLQAVNEGGRGVLVLDSGGTFYEFGYDYITDGYNTTPPATFDSGYKEWTEYFPSNIKVTSASSVIFDSKGRVVDAAGDLSSISFSFYDTESGSDVLFASACLSSIGVLTFDGSCS